MILKYLVLPFFTLFSIAQAQAPVVDSIPNEPKIAYNVVYELTEPIESQILRAFPTASTTMLAIAKCESGLKQSAVSPTGDFGVLQINEFYHGATAKRLGLDYKHSVADNIAMAVLIHKEGGFTRWECYNNGGYLKYL